MSNLENDEFGNRMKAYESVETARKFDESLPLYARLDGRGFSKFTRGLNRPYDDRLSGLMVDVTAELVKETKASAGYTQSDEISLVWKKCHSFDGKIQKIVSTLVSSCTANFMHGAVMELPPNYFDRKPTFDCRAINLPTQSEAANMMLWRHLDCKKNAVSMVAQHYFSHNELQNRKQADMRRMLLERPQIDFDRQYPEYFRYGTLVVPRSVQFEVGDVENSDIPEHHKVPGQVYTRTRYERLSVPLLHVANRIEVMFDSAEPVYRMSETDEDNQGV